MARPLGEEQVRVTVRLPKALYNDLTTLTSRGIFDHYLMLGDVIRKALVHYLECPQGPSWRGPSYEERMAAWKAMGEASSQRPKDSVAHVAPPPPPSSAIPTWKLGTVSGALKLLHAQNPDTLPTLEAIHAYCGKTLSMEEIDVILDALKRSGDYDRLFPR